jgi:hypothetical protein
MEWLVGEGGEEMDELVPELRPGMKVRVYGQEVVVTAISFAATVAESVAKIDCRDPTTADTQQVNGMQDDEFMEMLKRECMKFFNGGHRT